MSDESVKVAVRVRPFNQREKDRLAKLTIDMQGNTTIITNPENLTDKKVFTFDYSYWSHDEFVEDSNGFLIPDGPNSRYASQKSVFEDLGKSVLENAFIGYNCSLFAYGQTGSGKSYSMVGYGANKGIVPVICDELFKKMEMNSSDSMRYEVTFSMLEIYNENVRDLLSKEAQPKGGLPVRQTPFQGFFVQGLKKIPVGSYKEIESRMEQGTSSRTVAMTNMNATSSRAHTVVIITFDQITQSNGSDIRKSSIMNLVDLAGSERADSTGATGDRLKEGANINKSLSVLGNVISALADLSNGKKKTIVPYRDSVLTKLLQNALGGNSKTVMIAALSPADINYDETLGTLRYADRAKQIKNKAIVNENPVEKLLRELKVENERLKQALNSGNLPQTVNIQGLSSDEVSELRREIMEEFKAQMSANSEIIAAEDPKIWNARLEEARKEVAIISKEEKNEADKRSKLHHLLNLNEDPQLSGIIVHYLTEKLTLISRISGKEEMDTDDEDLELQKKSKNKKKVKSKPEKIEMNTIVLKGLSISNRHAIIERKNEHSFTIRPALAGAKTKLNGNTLTSECPLTHKDRILFGSHHMYLFIDPENVKENKNLPKLIDWEYAQNEIAHADGFGTENVKGLTKDQQVVQQQILEILPMISEVNAISEELEKSKTFEIILVPPNAQDSKYGSAKRTAIMIKVMDNKNGNFWIWERGKFMSRRYLMQEMYQQFLEDKSLKETISSKDPFWEPTGEVLIGTANVFLQALAFNLDFEDKIPILNYEGNEEGFISVSISPSTSNGRVIDEDNFVDDPKSLLTRTYHFLIGIASVELHNAKYTIGIKVRFRIFKDEKSFETETSKGSKSAVFNYNKVISFARITQEHLDYFLTGYITFRIFVNQDDSNKNVIRLDLLDANSTMKRPENRRISVIPLVDASEEIMKLKTDLTIITRKLERLERKDRKLKTLCNDFNSNSNGNYEAFHRATNAILFYGDNQKFRTDGMIIGNMVSYSNSKTNGMNDTNIDGTVKLDSQNSNSCIRETIVEEEETSETSMGQKMAIPHDTQSSKVCEIM